MKKILSKLPPINGNKVAELYLHAVIEEMLLNGNSQTDAILQELRSISTIDEVLLFLDCMKKVANHHPIWDYLAAAAVFDCSRQGRDTLTVKQLERLYKSIKGNFVLDPLRTIVLNYWKNSGLPTDGTYYDVVRPNQKH